MKPPVLPAVRSWRSTETDGRLQNLPRAGGSGQNAALTAERVSASLWRISPLAVSDAGLRRLWRRYRRGGLLDGAAAPYYAPCDANRGSLAPGPRSSLVSSGPNHISAR